MQARRVRHVLSVTDGALLLVAVCLLSLQAVIAERHPTSSSGGIDGRGVALLTTSVAFALLTVRAPTIGSLGALATTLAWYQLGYASSIVNVAHLAAFFLLGLAGDRRRQVIVGVVAVVATVTAMTVGSGEPVTSVAAAVGGTVAAIVLGAATRARREHLVGYAARAQRAEAEREAEARRRVAAARLEIARDLHDVLAHTVSLMTLQASVGQDALQRGTDGADAALATIRTAGRDAMREIEALIAVLRGGSRAPGTAPIPRLDRIADVVEATRATGLDVVLDVDVDPDTLSDLAHVTIYRVVQESLTNVIRHTTATRAMVSVSARGNDVVVEVLDDGRSPGGRTAPGGFGIQGMRERVESVGGRLVAGPRPEGGWCVRAAVPRRMTVVA